MKSGHGSGNAVPAHIRQAEEHQAQLIRAMTPYRRLEIAQDLYATAWKIKLARVWSSALSAGFRLSLSQPCR
jgi:hypothetical protein